MVLAQAALAGLLLGLLTRGRLRALADLQLGRVGLVYAAFVVQLAAFPSGMLPWTTPDIAARVLWLLSYALLIGFAASNRSVRGVAVVTLGLASNLAAIAANRGLMPANPAAVSDAGRAYSQHNNSFEAAAPNLAWLTDRWAVPSWIPLGNVFSIGDVLIAVGIAMTVVLAMHGRSRSARRRSPERTLTAAI